MFERCVMLDSINEVEWIEKENGIGLPTYLRLK